MLPLSDPAKPPRPLSHQGVIIVEGIDDARDKIHAIKHSSDPDNYQLNINLVLSYIMYLRHSSIEPLIFLPESRRVPAPYMLSRAGLSQGLDKSPRHQV